MSHLFRFDLHHAGHRSGRGQPIFAVSRISGWAAHVIEQLDDNRLSGPVPNISGRNTRLPTPRSKSLEQLLKNDARAVPFVVL